jgi:hypothetical protein
MHLATLNKEKKFGARMNPGVKIERRVHPAEKGVRLEPWASSSAHIQWLLMLAHNDVVHLSCPASCALPPRARSPSCGFTDGHLPGRRGGAHVRRGLHLALLLLWAAVISGLRC